MRRNLPPAFACWLVGFVLPGRYKEAMLGDLVEEYTLRAESTSPRAASLWFWSQACRSVPSMVWSAILSALRTRDGRISGFISMSVAMGVYIVMGMLKFGADWTITKLLAPEQTTYVVLAPVVFLTTSAIGGCISSRIRHGATMFLAVIVLITVAVLMQLQVCTIPVPWWYQFGFLTLGPMAVIFTPAVCRRSKQQGAAT